MNRRAFFSMLAAAATAQMDIERLLWVPGRKLISIPAANVRPSLFPVGVLWTLEGSNDGERWDIISVRTVSPGVKGGPLDLGLGHEYRFRRCSVQRHPEDQVMRPEYAIALRRLTSVNLVGLHQSYR
jgi:hypothetical protein